MLCFTLNPFMFGRSWRPSIFIAMNVNSFYLTPRWQRLRAAVMRRDKYTCQWSKKYSPFPVQAEIVHHIFPRQWFPEYQYEPWNLISLSKAAHNKMHNRDGETLTATGLELLRSTARKRNMQDVEQLILRIPKEKYRNRKKYY